MARWLLSILAMETTIANNWIHPFEARGMGRAPFTITGYTLAKFQACQGAPVQCGSSCDVCGTGIMHVYMVQSSDGRTFKVGCDCVQKTGDTSLTPQMKRARYEFINRDYLAQLKSQRAARELARLAAADRAMVEFSAGFDALYAIAVTSKSDYIRNWAHQTATFLLEGKVRDFTYYDRTSGREVDTTHNFWVNLARAFMAPSKYVSNPGTRLKNLTLTVTFVPSYDSMYGRQYINNMIDDNGNVYIWKTSTGPAGRPGDRLTITGTVKKHAEYNGEMQTELSRCKVA